MAVRVAGIAPLARVIRITSVGFNRKEMNCQAASPSLAFAVMPHCHDPIPVAVPRPKSGSGTIATSPGNAVVWSS